LASAKEMGLEHVFPRAVAGELARGLGEVILLRKGERKDELIAVVPHFCGPQCPGEVEGCLAALLVEALARARTGKHLVACCCTLGRGGNCEVTLLPLRETVGGQIGRSPEA
jgi:hypothetical protein